MIRFLLIWIKSNQIWFHSNLKTLESIRAGTHSPPPSLWFSCPFFNGKKVLAWKTFCVRFLGIDMIKRGCFGRFLVDDSSTLSLDLFLIGFWLMTHRPYLLISFLVWIWFKSKDRDKNEGTRSRISGLDLETFSRSDSERLK